VKNDGLYLFLVQDSDRPLYLFATDFAHALREWELQMRRENEFAEGEAVPGPDGVQCIAGPDEVLQPAWDPPTDAEVEGCDVDSLRAALFARNNDVDRIAAERDEAYSRLEEQRTRAEAAEAEVAEHARVSGGAADIASERARQTAKWGDAHDSQHVQAELVRAAKGLLSAVLCECAWDRWGLVVRHLDARERLVIAGALIAAEIDRRDRAAKRRAQGGAS
jgi:hypothetical protein